MNELQAGVEFPFTVLPQPAALFQPSEGAFDDPAFGQYRKGVQLITLEDLNGGFQALLYTIGKGLPGVAAIDQHAFNSLQIRPAAVDSLQGPAAIGHLGGGNGDGMGQPLRIHPSPRQFTRVLRVFAPRCATITLCKIRRDSRTE